MKSIELPEAMSTRQPYAESGYRLPYPVQLWESGQKVSIPEVDYQDGQAIIKQNSDSGTTMLTSRSIFEVKNRFDPEIFAHRMAAAPEWQCRNVIQDNPEILP